MALQTAATAITTVIAMLVAIITWQQWITNRARLKHDLFDRRYAIYEKIAEFPANIAIAGYVPPGADIQFMKDTALFYFVFNGDEAVKRIVDRIYELAVKLHQAEVEVAELSGSPRTENFDRQTKIKFELSEISGSLPGVFAKYLKLAH